MWQKELALRALTDLEFRNHTALGRKVAEATTIEDMATLDICPLCGQGLDAGYGPCTDCIVDDEIDPLPACLADDLDHIW